MAGEEQEESDVGELFAEDKKEDSPEVVDVGERNDDDKGNPEDQDCEGAAARVLPDLGEPTASQIEDHRAHGHVPYRSWCSECVEGRSTGEQHRHRTGERRICVFSFDYLYLDKSGKPIKRDALATMEDVDVTILVAKASRGKAVFSHVVPPKGVDMEHYALDVLMKDLKWLGFQQISLRSDNGRALLKLLEHAVTEARLEMISMHQVLE
jgi:hypothetical protein